MSGATKKQCELADVLLAFIDRTTGVPECYAILIQAKLSTTTTIALSNSSEQKQFELLSTRPVFDVTKSTAPKGVDLRHVSPDVALMYAIASQNSAPLPNGHPGQHYWLTAYNLSTLSRYSVAGRDCLAYTLVGLLLQNVGWKFALPPVGRNWTYFANAGTRDDWSALINYLLNATFRNPLSTALQASAGRTDRGQEEVIQLVAPNSSGQQMLAMTQGLAGSLTSQHFSEKGGSHPDGWQVLSQAKSLGISNGGDSSHGGGELDDNQSPEDGPISAVLFEVGG
jgi:hypothetical protein